ncbi:L-type lectin-domain containing receptor kinase IV.1-like [Musa acuminata AAA Group]|uniref:L-type lectin-domain containing receptor kinase IV.1-like n=1 Tax=Musa acuminata AAA Group TaxID=214697 RepID=UPI0031D8CFC4
MFSCSHIINGSSTQVLIIVSDGRPHSGLPQAEFMPSSELEPRLRWDAYRSQKPGCCFCEGMALLSRLPLLVLLAELAAASYDVGFVFDGFTGGANLSLNGYAEVTSDGLLKLTNFTPEATGHAFYPSPINFKNATNGRPISFSTTFVFAIVPVYPNMSGHGIAFALAPNRELPGSMPSQDLGLFNSSDHGQASNHVVAVELDTVKSVDFDDINANHVGIDVNSLKSLNASPVAYFDSREGVIKSLQLISGEPMQVWVDYHGRETKLDVMVAPLNEPKPAVPLVSSTINLSSIVLDEMYVGFSSATGAATGCHYILGWSFGLNRDAPPLDLSKLPKLPRQGGRTKRSTEVLAIELTLAAIILLLISTAVVAFIIRRRKKFSEMHEDWELEYGPHRFSYKDLYRATKGFHEQNLLGVGGFGRVYKGVLPTSKIEIAVKKISHDSKQGMREFISEIVSMGRLRHRNLVRLLGYCRRQGELLLVYDYMTNGSLDRHIFDLKRPPLSWSRRFHAIKGVAAGLLYLHDGWEKMVIHRDIKASNVLMDTEFNGRLGDFGLARLYDHGTNPQTTRIVGTLGYLAPELSMTGKATTQTDVYAFGAFLLEVACGRRPMDVHAPADTPNLVDYVLECWKMDAIAEARDPKLGDDYSAKEVELVLKLGLLCSHPDPMARPSMKQVMRFLEGDAPLPMTTAGNLISSVAKQRYDRTFDDFLMSYSSFSDASHVTHSATLLSTADDSAMQLDV